MQQSPKPFSLQSSKKHANLLKDKQKLFQKLFVNSSYQPTEQQTPLIVSPMYINLILKQLEQIKEERANSQQARLYKKSIVLEILNIFHQKVENSILCWNYDKDEQVSVLDNLIMQMLRLSDTQQDIASFQIFLSSLLHYYPIGLKNLSKLTQFLSRAFYLQDFNAIKLKFILKVTKKFYEIKKGLYELPIPFFYLYGQNSMGIKTLSRTMTQQNNQRIKNEFSFIVCFKMTEANYLKRQKLPILIHFKSNKQQLVFTLKQHIQITNKSTNKSLLVPYKLQVKKLYRIIFSISNSSTQIALNTQNFVLDPIIKKQSSDRQVQFITFGQAFEGMLSSILFVNKKIQIDKQFLFSQFPFGIEKWSTLKKMKTKNLKIIQKVVFAYLPFSIFQVRYKTYCFDIFKKIHGQILDNTIVFSQNYRQNDFSIMGGIKPILPLFYLSRSYSSKHYPNLLNDLLEIIQTILIKSNYSGKFIHSSGQIDLHYSSLNEQFLSNQTLMILGNHISNLHTFLNSQTFQVMFNIFSKLNDEEKIQFVKEVLWNVNIAKVTNEQTVKSYYVLLIKIYQNSKSHTLKSKSLFDIIYWIIQHFERRESKSFSHENNKKKIFLQNIIDTLVSPKNDNGPVLFCCLQHYLNQSVLYNNLDLESATKIQKNSYHKHYEWLQKILSIFMQYKFIQNFSEAEESIKILLRFLMKKYSTCFYLLILRVIKRQIKTIFSSSKNIQSNRNFIRKIFFEYHILSYLEFVSEKTISLDLVTQIFHFHLYFYQFSQLLDDQKNSIINFIEKTIARLSQVLNCSNPITIGAKRVRKKSEDLRKQVNEQVLSQISNLNRMQKLQYLKSEINNVDKSRQILMKSSHMKFQNFMPLFHLIQNYLTGQISQQILSDNVNINFKSEEAIVLLRVYFRSLNPVSILKLKLLKQILRYIHSNSSNRVFLMKSYEFNYLMVIQLASLKSMKDNSETSSEIKNCINRIYHEFFQTFVKQQRKHMFQIDISEFYSTMKRISTIKSPQIVPNLSNLKVNNESNKKIQCDLNFDYFEQVILLFERALTSIQDQSFFHPSYRNFFIQCTLILMSQSEYLEYYKKRFSWESVLLQPLMNNLKKLIQMSIMRILRHAKQSFLTDSSVKQITLKIVSHEKDEINSQNFDLQSINHSFLKLTYESIQKFIQTYRQRSKLKSLKLKTLKQLHEQPQFQINNLSQKFIDAKSIHSFFDLQLSTVKQGQINFIFDVIVPKMTSHFWLLYGESLETKQTVEKVQDHKNILLKDIVQKYLNSTTKKTVYVVQIYIDFLMKNIIDQMSPLIKNEDLENEEIKLHSEKTIASISEMINILLQVYNILAIQTICQQSKSQTSFITEKTSFLRMITYEINGFLYNLLGKEKSFEKYFQSNRLNDIFQNAYLTFWANFFSFMHFTLSLMEIKEQNLFFQTFQQIVSKISLKTNLKLFFIDFIRFFVLDRQSNEIIPVNKIKQFYFTYRNNQATEETNAWIRQIIFNPQFIQSLTLNSQIEFMRQKISSLNSYILRKKYQNVTKQKRFSLQNIPSETSINSLKFSQKSIKSVEDEKPNQLEKNIVDQKNLQIQKALEKQNVLEEDMRTLYFYNQEISIRKFHKVWQKMWRKMRLYHQPYGLWMAMRNDLSNFQYKVKSQSIKNFSFRTSKYTSQSGIKPILEAKIIEPWHINKTKFAQNKQEIACLTDMMRSNLQEQKQKQKRNQSGNDLVNMLAIWNYMWKIPYYNKNQSNKSKNQVFNVVWIKGNIKAQGRILINRFDQIEFWYDGTKQKDSHLTFQKFVLSYNKQMFKLWPIVMIKRISKRRYMMKYNALQLQFIDSLLVLLHFVDKNEEKFLSQLNQIRQEKIISLGAKIKTNNIQIFQSDWYFQKLPSDAISNITEKWKRHQISNLAYLMKLNTIASRSGLDLSQYPVVPWISSITTQKQPKFRDLTKTIGGQGSEERIKSLIEKFNSKDPFNPVPPFYYGTHYSSPGVVFNFLVRIEPFTGYLKSLQGGKFDLPDRLFSSMMSSWKSAFNEISDVRQLVPEFYYLPEIFINLENHNFGQTQSLQRIHNVQLPQWAANNPYYFIMQYRQMLESEEASQHLSDWIDLIFGYKQRGQEAEKNLNLYYYLTYQEYNDLDDEEDQVHKKSCEAQIVHFGQIPPQLFFKPHQKRSPSKKVLLQIKSVTTYLLMNKFTQKPVGIQLDEQKKSMIIIRRNAIEHYSTQKSPISLLRSYKFNLERSSSQLFYLWKKDSSRTIFFTQHPYFIVYGYVNNQIRIYHKVSGKLQKQEIMNTRIGYLHLNKEENLLLVGCVNGILHIHQIEFDNGKVYLEQVHEEVMEYGINHISEYDGFTAISFGSLCSIYKISRSLHYLGVQQRHYKPCVQFLRSFKNPLKITQSQIITSPLYSLIIVDNATIKSYSINGQLIRQLSCNVKSPIKLLKDNEMNEYLYFVQDERIVVMSTPDLRSIADLQVGDFITTWDEGLVFEDKISKIGW